MAHLADVSEAHVTALASMSLQASTGPAQGREAVELAHAARTAAGAGATPTLLSVLAAREAVGHAKSGDRQAATSAISEARRQLDHGRRDDDPFWLYFWGPADLASYEARIALTRGNKHLAEKSARFAFAGADPDRFTRNHTTYAVRLGSVLTQCGQLDEAMSVTGKAIQRPELISGSQRINADFGTP